MKTFDIVYHIKKGLEFNYFYAFEYLIEKWLEIKNKKDKNDN